MLPVDNSGTNNPFATCRQPENQFDNWEQTRNRPTPSRRLTFYPHNRAM